MKPDDLKQGDWVLVCAEVQSVAGDRVRLQFDGGSDVLSQAMVAVGSVRETIEAPVRAGDPIEGGRVLYVVGDRAWVLKDDGSDELVDLTKAQMRLAAKRSRDALDAKAALDE